MTRTTTLLLLSCSLGSFAPAGCATDEAARRDDETEAHGGGIPRAAERAAEARRRADGPPGMNVENEMGVLETADVEDTLQGHLEDVRACYDRAGKAQRYAGGDVKLRF